MKRILTFIAAGTIATATALSFVVVPAASDSILYMGRTLTGEDGSVSFNYPGVTALLNFKGTSLAMAARPGSGKFVVETDGGEPHKVVYAEGDSILTLAENLPDTLHSVRITYAIEGYEHNPQLRSFHIDGVLVAPPSRPGLKIEFIGNSITCGYGIEADDPEQHFSYDTENHTLTYACRTARALGADVNVVARSGIGIYRNFGSPREGDVGTMPLEYDYTLLYDHEHPWDHTRFIPDIICINLGTNDTSEDNYDISLFEARYREFLHHLRDLYPQARIVLLTGSMLGGDALDDVRQTLDRLAAEDDGFYRFDMSPQTGELGYGADYHPSRGQAERMADELTQFLSGMIRQ